LWRIGDGEQLFGCEIHALVGSLGRQYHRNQQLERRTVDEFGRGPRVGLAQPAEDFGSFGGIHS
jgi:hypothetical protein